MRRPGSRLSILGLLPVVAVLLLSLVACERERLSEPAAPEEEWTLGEPVSYDVPAEAGATIPDPVSAGTFRFPEGGGGTLTVTPVLDGPRMSADEGVFRVDYAGPSSVELLMADDPQASEYLLSWEQHEAMVLEGEEPDDCSWLPLPDLAESQAHTFALPLPAPAQAGKSAPARWAGVPVFKPLRVAKGTPHDTLTVRFEQNIRDASTSLLNAIPPARRADVIARANGSLSPKLYVDMNEPGSWWLSKPKYVPFWDHVLLTPRCALVIPNDSAPSIPHEVGHYFHHLLLDGGYGAFATNPLSSSHAVGTPGCRHNLIEEPAYLAEYYLKGAVGGRDPEWGSFVANGPGGLNDPGKVDFCDLEGFGVSVLASLVREVDWIRNYAGERVSVPVVEAPRDSLFHACYEIVALGTNDIPSLIDQVEAVLAARGQQDKLPAMLQPLGLTYRATVRIVDGTGDPVMDLTARPVCKVGPADYLLPLCKTPTDADGACSFDAIFPGGCTLRIYDGEDSTDVGTGVEVPWGQATTQTVALGTVTYVPNRLLEALHRKTMVAVGFGGVFEFANGDDEYTIEEHFDGANAPGDPPISWTDESFSYSGSGSYEDLCEGTIEWTLSISGTADIDARTMDASLSYEAKSAATDRYESSWSYQITDLPLTASSVPPYVTLRFRAHGAGASAYIGGVTARISHFCASYEPGNYTGCDWGNEVEPYVTIDFREPD